MDKDAFAFASTLRFNGERYHGLIYLWVHYISAEQEFGTNP